MTEHQLIEGCRNRDPSCQRALFDLFSPSMMSVALRYAANQQEAEDILQIGFIRIFASINEFRFEGSFEGWIRRIIVNCALRVVQRRKIPFLDVDDHQEDATMVKPEALSNLETKDILRLIASLPDGYRIVFNLYVLEGFDHSQIAKMLDITTSTSRTQLLKARKLLQQKIYSFTTIPNKYA